MELPPHLVGVHMTEVADLILHSLVHGELAPAEDDVRGEAEPAQLPHAGLGRFCLPRHSQISHKVVES